MGLAVTSRERTLSTFSNAGAESSCANLPEPLAASFGTSILAHRIHPQLPPHNLVTSPLNSYYTPITVKGELTTPFDLKQMMETGNFDVKVGAAEINDFTWHQKLSFDACTLCVRCTDACPATASGTKLSPMHLILKLKNYELSNDGGRRLHGDVIDPEELWACTTCRACVQECPVLIQHVEAIVDMRRHLMAEGKVDRKKRDLITSLSTVGNPYGLPTRTERNGRKD